MNKKYLILAVIIITSIVVLFFIFNKKLASSVVNYPPKNNTIIAFGDSLVEGVGATDGKDFISQLSIKIDRPIINMGVSGETSAQGLSRIDRVIAYDPGIVIILFGGNDYLRKIPKEETFNNLHQIISKLQSNGSMIVLLGIRGGVLNDKFESDFKSLAEENGSIYVSDVLRGLLTKTEYMSDSIHPNNIGYEKITERVYDAIKDYLK